MLLLILLTALFLNQRGKGGQCEYCSGQAWAGKSLESVGKPLIYRWNPRKLCEQ